MRRRPRFDRHLAHLELPRPWASDDALDGNSMQRTTAVVTVSMWESYFFSTPPNLARPVAEAPQRTRLSASSP